MADAYEYFRLKAAGRDSLALMDALREHTLPRWRQQGIECWGIWRGLFGVGSNELLVLAATPGEGDPPDFRSGLPESANVVDTLSLVSTARPEAIGGLPAEGLYVFRFFDVAEADCDEIVALSREAWETFEDTDRYASRPQGLFRPRPVHSKGAGRMLLVTWYDGFASWEISRAPAPEARDNFRRRHELTGGTIAHAVRLVSDHSL